MKLEDLKTSRLVYSTDPSQKLDAAKKPVSSESFQPPDKQKIWVKLDRKARKGKCVTIVEGLQARPEDIETLAKQLKTSCGSGGTVKDGNIEIQGEHREKIMDILAKLGYKPKASGG